MNQFAAGLAIPPERLSRTVTFGHPSRVILERAKATGAQLIVIGKHAAGFIERLVVGSVALQVLDQAQCDVLVVPETL
jgi:nucleotide-binding universal stress UspA family protein